MERAFVDTGAWIALANRRDPKHAAVAKELGSFDGRLVTSNFVFDEAVTRCLYGQHHAAAVTLGGQLQNEDLVDLRRIEIEDEREAWSLFVERADKDYSFTDCTSFVLMRRLGITTAVALDEDFAREGFRVLPAQ